MKQKDLWFPWFISNYFNNVKVNSLISVWYIYNVQWPTHHLFISRPSIVYNTGWRGDLKFEFLAPDADDKVVTVMTKATSGDEGVNADIYSNHEQTIHDKPIHGHIDEKNDEPFKHYSII